MRITISQRSDKDVERVKKRKRYLLCCEYFVYFVILAVVVFFTFFAVNYENDLVWNLSFVSFLFFSDELMFVITFASMFHIHRNSKSIEYIGVKTNSRLMKVYLAVWTCLNI